MPMPAIKPNFHAPASPFVLENQAEYESWRASKLAHFPKTANELVVPIENPQQISVAERERITAVCRKTNMVIYVCPAESAHEKTIVHEIGRAFGLTRLDPNMLADDDGVSSLEVMPGKSGRGYIPYSNQRLLWHTDGYYNRPDRYIRAFLLHCARPAASGGDNVLLDPEIAYIQIRDHNPDFIRALMAPDAMTIPENTEAGEGVRAAETGPVFSVDLQGNLHMRYTARTRSIVWKDNAMTRAAVSVLKELLETDSAFRFRHRLEAGEGLLCNNVLHNRSAFENNLDNGGGRLIYRARYYDRIAGTDINAANG